MSKLVQSTPDRVATPPTNASRPASYLIIALSVLLGLMAFQHWFVYYPISTDAVDGSWAIALNLIEQLKLRHGTEFVFTYGPFGYLIGTRSPISVKVWQMVLFDVWIIGQTSYIVWSVLSRYFSWYTVVAAIAIVLFLHNSAGIEPQYFIFYSVLFLLCEHQRDRNDYKLVYSLLVALLAFYTKGNVGLISLGCYFIYLTYLLINGRASWKWYGCHTALFFVLIFASASLLNVELLDYIKANFQVVESYNDVMAFYPLNDERAMAGALLTFAIYVAMMTTFIATRWYKWGFRVLMFYFIPLIFSAVGMFILFKHGMVRADGGHMCLYFKYAILPILLLWVYLPDRKFSIAMAGLAFLIAAGQMVFFAHNPEINQYQSLRSYASDAFRPARNLIPNKRQYPYTWWEKMCTSTVDAGSVDIAALYVSGLGKNYRPRPVIQAYQVTNRYLDSLNATFYESSRAPEFIVYTHDAIDTRYPSADEARTRLTMMRWYDLADKEPNRFLLKRRQAPRLTDTLAVQSVTTTLGQEVRVPTAPGIWVAQAFVDYSVPGKLIRLLFQPPGISMELEMSTGKKESYKASKPLLANGVLMDRWTPDTPSFLSYWDVASPPVTRIKSLRIVADRWAWGVKPEVRVVFTRLGISGVPQSEPVIAMK